jgi:PAS domain S-box-containing protein
MKSVKRIAAASGSGPKEAAALREAGLRSLYSLTDRLYRARSLHEALAAGLDAITSTLGCDRASILLFDDDGVMRFKAWRGLSEGYRRELEGHTPWRPGERDPAPIFVTDIDGTEEPAWIRARIREEGIRSLGFIPLTDAGGVTGKFMTYYRDVREFPPAEVELAVTIARQVGFAVERHRSDARRREAEAERHLSEERFRLMAENAPVMIWISDSQGRCLHLNRALREAWGVPMDSVTSFDWRTTMHPDDAPHIVAAVTSALAEAREFTVDGRYRTADGSIRIFRTTARPHFSASGALAGMIGVNADVTRDVEAAAHRELVFGELNHRVKNTLALVQAIARQTLKGAEAAPFAAAFEGRLANLAVAHGLLTRTNWEAVPLGQLVTDALMLRAEARPQVEAGGPEVSLAPKQALAVAMALHELNTNAAKHGALSVEEGRVTLGWDVAAQPSVLRLTWQEHGGPPVTAPAARGFGLFMVERILAQELGGDVAVEFPPEGLVCRIMAPVGRT